MNAALSERLVLQRIRNRIIEHLTLVSSFEEQERYQSSVPHVSVPSEVINLWEDYVDHERLLTYREPVFSPEEQNALHTFHAVWTVVADSMPVPLPKLNRAVTLLAWQRLRVAGSTALALFLRRGLFPEDEHAFTDEVGSPQHREQATPSSTPSGSGAAVARTASETWFAGYLHVLENESTTTSGQSGPYRCPCCRKRTLEERGGFEICSVCFWEDDGQDDADSDTIRGGPNGGLSLTQGRLNFANFGACEERFRSKVRGATPDEE